MTARPFEAVRRANAAVAREDVAYRRTELRARPRALFVELTRHCNLQCPMCRTAGETTIRARMSASLFERIAELLFPTADLVDLRGWGESLILPEFPERARYAASFGCELRVVTNLHFVQDAVLELLAELAMHVGVSVDSGHPAVMRVLRGGARLALVESNLRALATAFRARGHIDRLVLYATCQRPALPTLESVITLAARTGVRHVRLAPVTGGEAAGLATASVPDQVRNAVARASAVALREGVSLSLTASLFEGFRPNVSGDPCLHPWTYCYIAFDGRIGFCDHLIGPGGDPHIMGSLMTQAFDEVWNGPAWVALRKEHLAERRADAPHFEECAWCYRNRHVDFEDLLEPALAANRLRLVPVR